ncbi:MAG: DUF1176 domain-containing protein [Pseudomonadota bacterium]
MSVLIALSLSVSTLPVAPVPEPARFDDWMASCDNGRDCQALAASQDWSQDFWTLSVKRKADRAALPTIAIRPRFNETPSKFRVVVDGKEPGFPFDQSGDLTGDPQAFLSALAKGAEAKVLDGDGNIVGIIPTKGASAALRWIDDEQEREDTVTAIVARGEKLESAVQQPPALPTITVPPVSNEAPKTLEKDEIEAVQKAGDCYPFGPQEPEYFRLDEDHSLGLIPCGFGAYQGWSMAVTIDESGQWLPARMEQTSEWSEQDAADYPALGWTVTGPYFAHETTMLSGFAKGRGLADCGTATSWVWDGTMFRLAFYSAMNDCLGTLPSDWPILWRTTNYEAAPKD